MMKDKKAFLEFVSVMSDIHKEKVSELRLEALWRTVKPYSDEQCKKVFPALIATAKWFPKPWELIEAIEGKKEDRALIAWVQVKKAVKKYGYYNSVKFDDPVVHSVIRALGGWMRFSEELPLSFEGSQWYEKEFIRLYNVFSEHNIHPEHLGGFHELSNTSNGLEWHGSVVAIGIKEQKAIPGE